MKRLLCLLILLTLLLSACNGAKFPTLPSITEPSTTVPLPTAPPTSEDLPNGLSVKTDYSAYQPRKFTPKFTRLQDEPIYDLIPSDSYGKIYPFAGKTSYVSYADGYVYSEGYAYGMVTQDGCIVADPVYSYVRRLTLPYWVLEKRVPSSENEYAAETYCAIASLDGSVVTDAIYERVMDGGDRIIAIRSNDPLRFDLLDENLNVILSSEQLWQSEYLAPYHMEYSEGVFLLCYDLGSVDAYGYERSDYYFADETGEIIAGPFLYAYSFSGGLASVDIEEDVCTYIDLQGKPMERSFRYASSFHGADVAVVETEETTELIDRSGRTIFSFPSDECYMSAEEEYVVVTDAVTYAESIYGLDGTLIYDGTHHPELSLIYNTSVYECEGPQPYLLDALTNKRYDIPTEGYSYCSWTRVGDEYFIVLAYGDHEDGTRTYRILNDELEEITADVADYFPIYDSNYLMVKEQGAYTLMNEKGERVGTCPVSRMQNVEAYEDGVLTATDGFASYLFDENLALVFCYPLTNAMED